MQVHSTMEEARLELEARVKQLGSQFTRFTGTKVQILAQKALVEEECETAC
jgi:hypothetical protein